MYVLNNQYTTSHNAWNVHPLDGSMANEAMVSFRTAAYGPLKAHPKPAAGYCSLRQGQATHAMLSACGKERRVRHSFAIAEFFAVATDIYDYTGYITE